MKDIELERTQEMSMDGVCIYFKGFTITCSEDYKHDERMLEISEEPLHQLSLVGSVLGLKEKLGKKPVKMCLDG